MCQFLYADDIILIAQSVVSLQALLTLVEILLDDIDMRISASKSLCIHFGPMLIV